METALITRTAEISLEKEGYLRIKILPGSVIDEGDALDNFLVIKNLSAGNKQLKLIDGRGSWTITSKAREISRKNTSAENTIARAFVTDSYITKLMHDFLDSLSAPDLPQKFFTNETEAIEWLLSKKP